jgi:hypothetical protein
MSSFSCHRGAHGIAAILLLLAFAVGAEGAQETHAGHHGAAEGAAAEAGSEAGLHLLQGPPGAELVVRNDVPRRTLYVEYGPLELPAGVGYAGELVTVTVEVPFGIDGWVRSFEIELVDGEGRRVTEPVLHHAGLFQPNRRDLFSETMERIVAFGQETEAIRLPGQLGYRVTPEDSALLLGALYNTGPEHYEALHLRMTLVYADARRDPRHDDVLPLYLDVMPAGNRIYDIPPGVSSRSAEWSPAVDGRIIGLGGHLHQYGAALVLEDLTSGDTIWVGEAIHDEDHELLGVSRAVFHRGVPMRADRVYRITAVYDNPTGETVPGAMGKIGGVFVPERGAVLPPVRPGEPDYIRDWHAMVHHEHEHVHVRAGEQRVPMPGR